MQDEQLEEPPFDPSTIHAGGVALSNWERVPPYLLPAEISQAAIDGSAAVGTMTAEPIGDTDKPKVGYVVLTMPPHLWVVADKDGLPGFRLDLSLCATALMKGIFPDDADEPQYELIPLCPEARN